jgi:hypothetical protein
MQSKLENLINELEACDFWDCCFQLTSRHDLIDTIAFVNRQQRRQELIRAIATEEEKGMSHGTRKE